VKRALTAEFAEVKDQPEIAFQHVIIELAVLTFQIPALVVCLGLLRKRGVTTVAERAT